MGFAVIAKWEAAIYTKAVSAEKRDAASKVVKTLGKA